MIDETSDNQEKGRTWRDKLDRFHRVELDKLKKSDIIDLLEELPEDVFFNRPLMVKSYEEGELTPLGDPGKIYFDKTNKKLKFYVDSTGKWADLLYTTTSTTTSTSTSTSTTT